MHDNQVSSKLFLRVALALQIAKRLCSLKGLFFPQGWFTSQRTEPGVWRGTAPLQGLTQRYQWHALQRFGNVIARNCITAAHIKGERQQCSTYEVHFWPGWHQYERRYQIILRVAPFLLHIIFPLSCVGISIVIKLPDSLSILKLQQLSLLRILTPLPAFKATISLLGGSLGISHNNHQTLQT